MEATKCTEKLSFRKVISDVTRKCFTYLLFVSETSCFSSRSEQGLSRLEKLLPVGPRTKGGPTLRLLTYTNLHFLKKLLM